MWAMLFKEMDQDEILKIVEKYDDILTPLVEADQQIYDCQVCPRCGSSMYVKADIHRLLANNRPIPKHLVKCAACDCVVDPFSGIMVEMGNLGLLEPAVPLIHINDD